MTCADGAQCRRGVCLGERCGRRRLCPNANEVCYRGYCVDNCAIIDCDDGQTCVDGVCVDP